MGIPKDGNSTAAGGSATGAAPATAGSPGAPASASSPGSAGAPAKRVSKGRSASTIALLAFLLVLTMLISFTLGHFDITVPEVIGVALNQLFGIGEIEEPAHLTVIRQVRFPRIVAAVVIGMALAGAGASYQGLFKNPMVSPDLLGASAGAGFGACLALLLGWNLLMVQVTAFVFGIVAVSLTYAISVIVSRGHSMTLCLVLTGIVVSALFQAFITMGKYVADPNDKLPAITYWLMGGLTSIHLDDLPMLLIPVAVGIVPMLAFRYQLNALSFGDEEARALGVNTSALRFLYIACATLVTASAVAAAGMVGWVGLVIPHLARMIVGPNNKVLLPASLLLGGIYLLVIDDMCRCLFSLELPLSVLTAVIGAPFFIYLLTRGRKTWA